MTGTAGSVPSESLLPSGASAENAKAYKDPEPDNDQASNAYQSSSDGETSSVLIQRRSPSQKPTRLRFLEESSISSQQPSCLRGIMVSSEYFSQELLSINQCSQHTRFQKVSLLP